MSSLQNKEEEDDYIFNDVYMSAGKHLEEFNKLNLELELSPEPDDEGSELGSEWDVDLEESSTEEKKECLVKVKHLVSFSPLMCEPSSSKSPGRVTKRQTSRGQQKAEGQKQPPASKRRKSRRKNPVNASSLKPDKPINIVEGEPILINTLSIMLSDNNGELDTSMPSKVIPEKPRLINNEAILLDDSDEYVKPLSVFEQHSSGDLEDFFNSIVVEEDPNWEVSINVCWSFGNVHRFSLRRYQKMKSIFEFFAKLEKIQEDEVLFIINDDYIKPSDTPDSLNLRITDIIDGLKGSLPKLSDTANQAQSQPPVGKDSIQLKVLMEGKKGLVYVTMKKTEKMIVLMYKVAEQLEVTLDKLKFSFDGDVLDRKVNPMDLDLEGGEIIDLEVLPSASSE